MKRRIPQLMHFSGEKQRDKISSSDDGNDDCYYDDRNDCYKGVSHNDSNDDDC